MVDTSANDYSKVKYVVVFTSTKASRKRDEIRKMNDKISKLFGTDTKTA